MAPTTWRNAALIALTTAALSYASTAASGDGGRSDRIRYQQPEDVFYNHYANGAGAVPARMYVSPLPVPANVGHTYHTYPPLYPHELMHGHTRAWYTHHPGSGWTRTKAYYGTGGGLFGLLSHMRRYGHNNTRNLTHW